MPPPETPSLVPALAASAPSTAGPRRLVAIPCLNEELTIASVVLRARKHADRVLVVDDGSTDQTAEVAKLAGATVLPQDRRRGKGAAVRAAFRYAKANAFDALVLMDGDGQHDPREIPLVLEPILRETEPVDVALGSRVLGPGEMPLYRRMGKTVLDYATSMTSGAPVTDSQCGFRGFGRRAIGILADQLHSDDFSIESETVTVAHAEQLVMENVAVHVRYDGVDANTQNPVSHGVGVLNQIVIALTMRRPLLTLGLPGLLLVLAGSYFGMRMLQVYDRAQIFVMSYALAGATLIILGTIAIATALMMNMFVLMRKSFRAA